MLPTILIDTHRKDFDTQVVSAALKKSNINIIEFIGSELSELITFEFESNDFVINLMKNGEKFSSNDIDVVWKRRTQYPISPSFVHEDDRAFVNLQMSHSHRAIMLFLEDAFWINPEIATRKANSKPYQLKLAKEIGFFTPKTLISNNKNKIHLFIQSNDKTIYKPLFPYSWAEIDKVYSTYTATVSEEQISDVSLMMVNPGIFQELVCKEFEVRVQFFGTSYFAIKIDSKKLNMGELDWRISQDEMSNCEPINLPEHIFIKCRKLMEELNIVSGGFDFIVTNKSEWIFLEVNEAGQFLFIEKLCPELFVLDAFCSFLISCNPNFKYIKNSNPLRLKSICEDNNLAY